MILLDGPCFAKSWILEELITSSLLQVLLKWDLSSTKLEKNTRGPASSTFYANQDLLLFVQPPSKNLHTLSLPLGLGAAKTDKAIFRFSGRRKCDFKPALAVWREFRPFSRHNFFPWQKWKSEGKRLFAPIALRNRIPIFCPDSQRRFQGTQTATSFLGNNHISLGPYDFSSHHAASGKSQMRTIHFRINNLLCAKVPGT